MQSVLRVCEMIYLRSRLLCMPCVRCAHGWRAVLTRSVITPLHRAGAVRYGDPGGHDYFDNLFRFALLSWAGLEAPLLLPTVAPFGERVVFVANDWQTGLVPLILTSHYRRWRVYGPARSVCVVHNMGYQGDFPNPQVPPPAVVGEGETSVALEGRPRKCWKSGWNVGIASCAGRAGHSDRGGNAQAEICRRRNGGRGLRRHGPRLCVWRACAASDRDRVALAFGEPVTAREPGLWPGGPGRCTTTTCRTRG